MNKTQKNILNNQKNRVDPKIIPYRKLYTGAKIPAIGLGTFGSDQIDSNTVAEAVWGAAMAGYRQFDCASVYGNEKEIGRVFKKIIDSGVSRKELWVTSKLWNDMHEQDNVRKSCLKTLADLQLDYLDLYLVHWPFPNYHPANCDVSSRSPDAKPYIHKNFMVTWRAMEQLVKEGLVKHIGTSNMTIPKLELLLKDAKIKPAANEMELHPHFQQPELFQYVLDQGILPIGYCPIGSPARPERDKTPEDTVDTEDPTIVKIAKKHGIHPATLCVKWAVQRGQIPIPFSTTPRNYLANLKSTISEPLSDEEMSEISKIDKQCRLVKGHVFLWKEEQTWEALWDLDGKITPE